MGRANVFFADIVDYARAQGVPIVSPSEAEEVFGNIVQIKGRDEITIDADGKLTSTNIGDKMIIDSFNARKKSDGILTYPFKTITITPIDNAYAVSNGFPEGVGGILKTYRLSPEYYTNYQEYIPTLGTKKHINEI